MSDRPSGYRGALPTRNDALAKPWVIAVVVIFVLIFALAALGFPSKTFPRTPVPSASAAASFAPSAPAQ